ncbi:MAG: cell wall hydrolase [Rhodospirillales bacterium]|jgi:N-acetylmuramoyl-L-alanine amidase|nr:cell wall hydrolase [Rhodospirillales bacterium]
MSAAVQVRSVTSVEVLAMTLWGEAAERPVRAIEGVAAAIINRVRMVAAPDGPRHWGRGVGGVCRAPFQFGCWHPRHPRHAPMLALGEDDVALAMCRRIAARAASGVLPDPTGGATHYHAAARLPAWAVGRVPEAEIGGLLFYRLAI